MPPWNRLQRWLAFLLPGLLVACGGQSCTSCAGPLPPPQTPTALMLAESTQARITQHGFDVIAKHMVALLKAVLGAGPGGVAQIDVAKLLGPQPLQFSGGLGIFNGKAGARDLVLTFDLASLQIDLVEGSNPAQIRIAFDHAKIGVQQGVIFGQASVAGISSDAACHLHNGLQAGQPGAHLATMSGEIDLVLGVDAQGKLAIQVKVSKPVLHEVGFTLSKDCGLQECTDKVLLESPCLECELCATGKLASDAVSALKDALGPVLTQLLELTGNLLVKQVLAGAINGKPLDVEIPLDVRALLAQASPQLAGLTGETAGPLLLRGRPSPQAFVVVDKALQARLDAGVFAMAHPCAVEPGLDATTVFAQLPQGPAPPLPATMATTGIDGQLTAKPVDIALLLASRTIEEAVWAVLRSGLLCAEVDSGQLYAIAGGKLLVTAGTLDLAMPGVRALSSNGAPLRIAIHPSAKPQHAPMVTLAQEATATGLTLRVRDLGVTVEARVHGRWLTVTELQSDVDVRVALQVLGTQLALTVQDVAVPKVAVVGDPVAPYADWQGLAPVVAKLAVQLLLAQPLRFDVDVQAALAQVLALPIGADLVGVQAAGQNNDWLLLGIGLSDLPAQGGP